MSQRLKVANGDRNISNVISVAAAALASSMIQAMIPQSTMQNDAGSPESPEQLAMINM